MTTSKFIAAWDPGGTTGVCVGLLDPTTAAGFRVVYSNIIPWAHRFSDTRALLDRYQPRTTIVERFILYRNKVQDQVGSSFPSAQFIGIIEAYLYMSGLALPVYQAAALIAGQPPVKVHPEHASLLYKGTAIDREHALDAYKHLRYWAEQQHRTPVQPRRRMP